MSESITEQVTREVTRDSRMSAPGVKQLLDGKPISSAEDRKRLAGYMFWVAGRLATCPPAPPSQYTGNFLRQH
jgi:hypothetical protein